MSAVNTTSPGPETFQIVDIKEGTMPSNTQNSHIIYLLS